MSLRNKKIISEFEKLLDQLKLEFDNAPDNKTRKSNSYRIMSIKKVITILKKYKKKINSSDQLKDIKGIGKGTIKRIDEILETGKLSEIDINAYNKKYLKQINELMTIIGVGRKLAHTLITKHKIKSIKDMIIARDLNTIDFSHQVIMGLKYNNIYKKNIPRKEVQLIDKYLHKIAAKIDIELHCIICGSYRRLKLVSNDIDVLITHPQVIGLRDIENKPNYLKKLVNKLKKNKFIVDDMTDKDYSVKYMGFCKIKDDVRRIDIRYVPYKSYYAALLYFTGSGNFNKKMRTIAESLGYKLNEYGLYKKKKDKLKRMHIDSEKDIFDILGMEYISPDKRN